MPDWDDALMEYTRGQLDQDQMLCWLTYPRSCTVEQPNFSGKLVTDPDQRLEYLVQYVLFIIQSIMLN
jgi:hypothetical protein